MIFIPWMEERRDRDRVGVLFQSTTPMSGWLTERVLDRVHVLDRV